MLMTIPRISIWQRTFASITGMNAPTNHWVSVIRPELSTIRGMPNKLTLQQKSMRQRVNPILREVIKWVNQEKKPSASDLRGKPKDLQAYANMWELLHIKEGILYMKSELGGANRWWHGGPA